MSAPWPAASRIASVIFAALPVRSALVGLIWARATRMACGANIPFVALRSWSVASLACLALASVAPRDLPRHPRLLFDAPGLAAVKARARAPALGGAGAGGGEGRGGGAGGGADHVAAARAGGVGAARPAADSVDHEARRTRSAGRAEGARVRARPAGARADLCHGVHADRRS